MNYDDINETPLWPLLPNWKVPVVETLEFQTRIIGPTLNGKRQKRRMRIAPRRTFSFESHPHRASRRLLDNIRFAVGKRVWYLPIWHDRQSLADTLSSGSNTILCNTQGYDFAAGRYAVLRKPAIFTTEYEIVQVDTISTGSVNLVGTTASEWPAGTHLFPVRLARIADDANTVSIINGEVSNYGVKFEVAETCDWVPVDLASEEGVLYDVFYDYPILPIGTDWANARSHAFERIITAVDNNTSIPTYFDFPDKSFINLNFYRTDKDRGLQADTRALLYALAGRYKSVWVPTYTNDLLIASDLPSSGTFDIENCRYSAYVDQAEGRNAIRVELYDGSVAYGKITSSEDNGATERLYTNVDFGSDVAQAKVRRISFMSLMEQVSDVATITHLTNEVATIPFAFESVYDAENRERGGLG